MRSMSRTIAVHALATAAFAAAAALGTAQPAAALPSPGEFLRVWVTDPQGSTLVTTSGVNRVAVYRGNQGPSTYPVTLRGFRPNDSTDPVALIGTEEYGCAPDNRSPDTVTGSRPIDTGYQSRAAVHSADLATAPLTCPAGTVLSHVTVTAHAVQPDGSSTADVSVGWHIGWIG